MILKSRCFLVFFLCLNKFIATNYDGEDEVFYIVDLDGNETKINVDDAYAYEDYVVFRDGDVFGIMDWDGEIVVKAKYASIGD